MKKMLIMLLILKGASISAQIKTIPINSLKNDNAVTQYDSILNFVGKDIDSYIGQKFYLPKVTGYTKEHGFHSFKKNLKGDVYEPIKYTKLTKYESVAGKYFDVLSVRRDTKAYKGDIYIELKDCDNGKILYFDYKNENSLFPFIVVGYYEKMKANFVGNTFLLDMQSPFMKNIDGIKTENAYIYERYMNFKCLDYIIEENSSWEEFLLLENINHSRIRLSARNFQRIENVSKSDFMTTKTIYELKQKEIEKRALYYKKEQEAIEMSMLEAKKLIGKTIYNKTEFVYCVDNDNIETIEKYIPLTVFEVEYGNSYYPVKLLFKDMKGNKYYKKVTFDKTSNPQYEFELLFNLSDIRKQYPYINDFTWNLIKKGRVRIGMTEKECELSWGVPNDINTTTGSWGEHKQWVYDDSYLYFENGKLSSIQN
jgi:hypothetical protein